jgi:hypothetical protein
MPFNEYDHAELNKALDYAVVCANDKQQRAALDECIARHETWLATNGAEGERLELGSAGPALVDWSDTVRG